MSQTNRSRFVIPTGAKRSGGTCSGYALSLNMSMRKHSYFVYLMASRTRVLYCGMTNNLIRRVAEHKSGKIEGFSKRYKCHRLVWFERYQYVNNAIARERQIKNWARKKKLARIEEINSSWADLSECWFRAETAGSSTTLRSGRDDKNLFHENSGVENLDTI